jgi:hypothetical protein
MKYTVEIFGNGIELGVGKLSNEQYNFWSRIENKKFFDDAVRLDIDESAITVPEKAKFKKDFLDMTEYGSVTGMPFLDDEGPFIEVVTSTGEEVFKGTYSQYTEKYDPEYDDLLISEVQKDHIDYPKDADYVIFWQRYLKGTFFKAEIDTDKFDPIKLKFSQIEILGGLDLLVYVEYDGVEVEVNDYSIREISTTVEMVSC